MSARSTSPTPRASARRFPAATAAFAALALAVAVPNATAQQAAPTGPLVLEPLHEGIAFVPESRLTDLDGEAGTLVGGFVGFLSDSTFFLGGGGYWLADGGHDRGLGYGGVMAEWSVLRGDRVGLALRGLVGAGSGRLPTDVTLPLPQRRGPRFFHEHEGEPELRQVRVQARREFFVFEPQATFTLRLARWAQLGLGVGYRLTEGGGSLDERLRGVSGSVSVRLGSF